MTSDPRSAPEDGKMVDDSSLPILPEVVRSNDINAFDELMKPNPAVQPTTSKEDEDFDDGHRKEQQSPLKPENTKPTTALCDGNDDISGELPSLSLVEEAKKRLSAHGLKTETTDTRSPSFKPISPPRFQNKKGTTKGYHEATVNDFKNDGVVDGGSNARASGDAKENIENDTDKPSSLSRVEEAMKRTSLMVLKHNQRSRGIRTEDLSSRLTESTGSSSTTEGATMVDPNGSTKGDESNRLAALQRDIMSLKSSLSDMNSQLNKETIISVEKKSSTLRNGDGIEHNKKSECGVSKKHTKDENSIDSNSDALKYNDIPSTTLPANSVSIDSSPAKISSTEGDCRNSLEQSTAVVTPDTEIDDEKLQKYGDGVVEPPTMKGDSSLHQTTCDAVSFDNDNNDDNELLSFKGKKNTSTDAGEGDLKEHNVTIETTDTSLTLDKSHDTRGESVVSYRKMTPKKDLQGSDKSARWLEEELRRRAVVKREINSAIEARGRPSSGGENINDSKKSSINELPSISSPPEIQNSQSTMDEEVAAITANDERNRLISIQNISRPSHDGQETPSLSRTDIDKNVSRKLDYGNHEDQPHDELMSKHKKLAGDIGYQGFRPVFDYQDIQHEMKKFASETRAALREQSFTDIVKDPSSSALPVAFSSPLSVNPSLEMGHSNNRPDFQMNAVSNSTTKTSNLQATESISINFAAMEAGEVPKMLLSMDSFDGIASGDIFLSLLSENMGRAETSVAATWADRVRGAIWRARRMRRSMMHGAPENPPSKPFLSGGSQTVAAIQNAALFHLKHDEIDDAINLLEGIVFAYYSYFERSLNFREKNPTLDNGAGTIDFKPYIGMALHNLGLLNLLKGDYNEALSYFTRAVDNRKNNLGEDHPHYISSLVRLAICRYALNEFAEAHAGLEEALACANRKRSTTLEGRLQVAEILNNLGCLAYMSGQPTTASSYYRDSMDIQFDALSDSLYLGNAMSGQSISLNISIARANIGFIKLVTKDLSIAITALENALMEQQILLKGIDDTLIATMDHLALSNLLVGSQEKAALMYNRILTLQKNEYGPNDRRCFVTVEKMNMVQGKGVQYEGAIEELRKTFYVPPASSSLGASLGKDKTQRSPRRQKHSQTQKSGAKGKKKNVLKAFTSMMKKNP